MGGVWPWQQGFIVENDIGGQVIGLGDGEAQGFELGVEGFVGFCFQNIVRARSR